LLSLARRSSLGLFLVVPNFIHLRIMEATVFLGTFVAADVFWYPSSDQCLVSQRIIPLTSCPHGLVFDFAIHVQSIEFTTAGLQSSCRNISRMINGKQDAPELNFLVIHLFLCECLLV
jgi:hypothetical protein